MASYARMLQQANALTDRKNTELRITRLIEHIQHLKGRNGRAQRVRSLTRKLHRLQRAYALRSLIGWGTAGHTSLPYAGTVVAHRSGGGLVGYTPRAVTLDNAT